MSWDSYKLTDAIEAMKNGLHTINREITAKDAQVRKLNGEIGIMRRESDARANMLNAMKRLQETMPEGETVKFVVPAEYR